MQRALRPREHVSVSSRGHGLCTPHIQPLGSMHVPVQFKTSGCLFSIIASIVLTIVLNLLLRSCA
jgi:hypothetical protein